MDNDIYIYGHCVLVHLKSKVHPSVCIFSSHIVANKAVILTAETTLICLFLFIITSYQRNKMLPKESWEGRAKFTVYCRIPETVVL